MQPEVGGMLSAGVSWTVAAVLAVGHWVLAVIACQHNATTFDEVAHISGGMAMVVHGDFRLNPENGVLPQMLAGAAIVADGNRFPDVSDLRTLEGLSWLHSDSWELGYKTLYQVGNDAARVLLLGRAAVGLSGFMTVLLVHGMARHVHHAHPVGSLLPTLLAAACPTMLAHGFLITSDAVFTFTAALASCSVWAMLNAAAAAAARSLEAAEGQVAQTFCTRFTCFTSTKVQIMTPEECGGGGGSAGQRRWRLLGASAD